MAQALAGVTDAPRMHSLRLLGVAVGRLCAGFAPGVVLPESQRATQWAGRLQLDPKVSGNVGLTDWLTLAGEVGWHRGGLSMHAFARTAPELDLKIAAGATAGLFVWEYSGWAELGIVPRIDERWSGYVGLGCMAGRFRHILNVSHDLNPAPTQGDGVMPTLAPFVDLVRNEARVRMPIGVSVRPNVQGARSYSLTAMPYMTVWHQEPSVINCYRCESNVSMVEFTQRWGVEFQAAMRF